MRFLVEDEFDIEPGTLRSLRQWLATHEDALRVACPAGVVYLGTFAVMYTTGDEGADVHVSWGMESPSALHDFEAVAARPGPLQRLLEELHGFARGRGRGRRRHDAHTVLTAVVA